MFKDKVLLITGGTGSFGNKVLDKFLDSDLKEIRIFSRDEKKQDDMRKKYNNPKLKFYIGDVRDINSVDGVMRGVDFIFHAAALKQVPSCEFFPMQAVNTNVYGTNNVLTSAVNHGVQKVICLSTDKAAYPINAMGVSKAMMERVATAKAREIGENGTTICLTRYGNVMGSRGSVIPLFYDLIEQGKPLTITDGSMTRFMMTLDEAVELVLYAFCHGKQGDLFVQKSPAATIDTLAKAICMYKNAELNTKNIGIRHGEKNYEVLVTMEEMAKAISLPDYYCVHMDSRDLNYNTYMDQGMDMGQLSGSYTSDNTERLDEKGVIRLLKKMGNPLR